MKIKKKIHQNSNYFYLLIFKFFSFAFFYFTIQNCTINCHRNEYGSWKHTLVYLFFMIKTCYLKIRSTYVYRVEIKQIKKYVYVKKTYYVEWKTKSEFDESTFYVAVEMFVNYLFDYTSTVSIVLFYFKTTQLKSISCTKTSWWINDTHWKSDYYFTNEHS